MPLTVAALYQFVALPDVAALQAPLQALCTELGITGTLLLAPEGVNGTVAGSDAAIDAFLAALRSGPLFAVASPISTASCRGPRRRRSASSRSG